MVDKNIYRRLCKDNYDEVYVIFTILLMMDKLFCDYCNKSLELTLQNNISVKNNR